MKKNSKKATANQWQNKKSDYCRPNESRKAKVYAAKATSMDNWEEDDDYGYDDEEEE